MSFFYKHSLNNICLIVFFDIVRDDINNDAIEFFFFELSSKFQIEYRIKFCQHEKKFQFFVNIFEKHFE